MIQGAKGVITPIVTPTNEDETVCEEGLKRVINYVIEGGVHGIFPMGSNGEFYAFDRDEYEKVIALSVECADKRVPVLAGASAITTKSTIALARIAEKAGADLLSILTPMYIQLNDIEMYEHFKTIANSVSIPILLYNNPARTNNSISVHLLKQLAEIDNIVGIKNTSLDFSLTVKYIEATKDYPDFNVLCGSDYYIFATLMHGGSGCVAGTANVAPRLVSDIYDKFMESDFNGSLEAQMKLFPLRDAYSYGSFPVVMKECLNIMGLDLGEAVRPIMKCSADRHDALKRILKEMHLLNDIES